MTWFVCPTKGTLGVNLASIRAVPTPWTRILGIGLWTEVFYHVGGLGYGLPRLPGGVRRRERFVVVGGLQSWAGWWNGSPVAVLLTSREFSKNSVCNTSAS